MPEQYLTSWPDGERVVACFTFDLDAESAVLSADPSSASRLGVMSHQAYGPLVGVPRLLRLLDRHSVRATFLRTRVFRPSLPGGCAVDHRCRP